VDRILRSLIGRGIKVAFKVNERVGDNWVCRGESESYGGAVSLLREIEAGRLQTMADSQLEPEFEIKAVFARPANDGKAVPTNEPFLLRDPPAPSLRERAQSLFHALQVLVAIFLALLALAIVMPSSCTSSDSAGRDRYNHL
jgi:hypothetical protein